jgi:hypothetical protein
MALVALLASVAVLLGTAQPARAAQTTPPWYAHSWYINDVTNASAQNTTSTMYNLGYRDGQWMTSHCINSVTVLDFGQPAWSATDARYGGYGSDLYAPGNPLVNDAVIAQAAEDYALGWYNATRCGVLHLSVGTNNFHQCWMGSPCSISTAGAKWGQMIDAIHNYLVAHKMAWQIAISASDDMETTWDSAAATRQFVDTFNANDPAGLAFYDFGDALRSSTWTDADVYYVAWGASKDLALPEIYVHSAADRWTAVKKEYLNGNAGALIFSGVLSECHNTYPLPQTNTTCSNPSGEYVPYSAWRALWSDLQANGVGQTSLNYASNIKFQGQP